MKLPPPFQIKTITDYHKFMELPKPQHPLISVVKFESIKKQSDGNYVGFSNGFYSIALKKTINAKMIYGQNEYDFDEGVLAFVAPNQIINIVYQNNQPIEHKGWLLIFHPDFIWNTTLASKIKKYDFFGYNLNEALHLSDKEEKMLLNIIKNIENEYNSNIDGFSQDVIIAQIELLLIYSERFYQRQFNTRKKLNYTLLEQLENLLSDYFQNDKKEIIGIPSVQYISEKLNLSPNYLSRLLKTATGQSTQQFIQNKLIDLAKEKLSTTNLSISEIAFQLGFEHQQSFSKLFKNKTSFTPLAFRASFN